MQRLAGAINRALLGITRHWLALANTVMGLVLGLSFLAPWLMLSGHDAAGRLLYLAYRPLCHQLPERSFFIGGARPWYGLAELNEHLGYLAPARFLGDAYLGYKSAFCQRDVAIYAGHLLGGLLFGLLRRRVRVGRWQVFLLVIGLLPIALDGTAQLLGLLESTALRRTVTGLLFGASLVWCAFPWIDIGMAEAHQIARRSLEAEHAAD